MNSFCLSDTTCSDYLDVILNFASIMRDDAPDLLLFDVGSARSRGDTNVDSALSRAKVKSFPALILVRDGVETARYNGFDIKDDAPYNLFINNNLINEDLLNELLNNQEE